MVFKPRFILPVLLVGVLSQSCATLFTGTHDRIYFNSIPAGATVEIDGFPQGVTPTSVLVKRTLSSKTAVLRLEGYQTRQFQVDQTFNAVSLLDFLWLPLFWIPGIVDLATGAVMRYDPKGYNIELVKKPDAGI